MAAWSNSLSDTMAAAPTRGRSKSLGRARKRARHALASQQQQDDDDEPWSRHRTISDAMEANAGAARSGVVAWPDCLAWRPKSMFDLYYKLQRVVHISEWEMFHGSLRKPLPVTFRFVADATTAFRSEGETLLERWAAVGLGTRRLGLVDGWQLHLDKHGLREAEAGSEEARLREWLIRGTDAGYLIRQEVASMLPGALVDVRPGCTVLDMCAAPGSKTTQLVERLGDPRTGGGGVVVANDASALRAYTLVKRTASLGARAAALVVTCHRAQCMPQLPGGGGFDRIICDVPCTGDGTTRKHPEVFARWEVALAMRQHPLQLQIAMRGAALLAVGGTMVYSTCSLNPIENEAVVAELLRRCGGALELCDGAADVATQLAGGCAPGMEAWPVLDFRLEKHATAGALHAAASSVPPGERHLYMSSMWPPPPAEAARLALRKCVRLLPHRSDSGGFFVAKLRKVRALRPHPSPEWPRGAPGGGAAADAATRPAATTAATDAAVNDSASGERSDGTEHRYAPLAAAALARVSRARPTAASAQQHAARLYARSADAARIVYMTDAAARCCVGEGSQLRVVHAGATVLRRQRARRPGGAAGGAGERPAAAQYHATAEGEVLLA